MTNIIKKIFDWKGWLTVSEVVMERSMMAQQADVMPELRALHLDSEAVGS